jgi:hypothetical protein
MILLAVVAALASLPAAAQAGGAPSDPWQPLRPNAQAAQRPLGPNGRAAQRAGAADAAAVQARKQAGEETYYPSCAAARTERQTPIRRGERGYGRHLDRDGDGLACR